MRHRSLVSRVVALAAGVALVVGALVATLLFAVVSLRHAESRESRSKDVAVQALRVRALSADLESSLRGYVLSDNQQFLALFRAARQRVPGETARLRSLVAAEPPQRRRAEDVRTGLEGYIRDYAENIMVIAQIDPRTARGQAAGDEAKIRMRRIRGALGAILAVENRRVTSLSHRARTAANVALVTAVVAAVASMGLVLLFGAWVAGGVARPVRRMAVAATDVARGNLGVRVEEGGTGEVGALVTAFNSMTRALETSTEELLAQNERLRESERHQRDLIGMVSHELRTPLAAVLGFTALLLQRDFGVEERRRYLEIIDAQARRLARLAGDFLDVQLLEGGGLTLVLEEFDLGELVREQTRLFFTGQSEHTPELSLADEAVVVRADRDRLSQVVGNLLSNAVKYSPSGSTVHIAVSRSNGDALVQVGDEGVGIASADAGRIFEKFFRADETAATVGGTGLGLTVAREIVQTHGGTIEVDSEPGRGATFTVRLPVAA